MKVRAIEENTILFRQNMQPVGRIMEVFGQVEHPYYILRWPKSIENPALQVGENVFMNNTDVKYILPAQLNRVGTDASNVYDEEPSEKERIQIECTEDVKGEEVPDESGLVEEVNYQQDYVIPSVSVSRKRGNFRGHASPMQFQQPNRTQQMPAMPTVPAMQYPFPYQTMSTQQQTALPTTTSIPAPTPVQAAADTSGLDILMNSYF